MLANFYPDNILWFLQNMEHQTINEVDRLIGQIEVKADAQQRSSTQHADSVSAISGHNFVNTDFEELKRLHDLTSTKTQNAQLTPGLIGLKRGEYPEKCPGN